MKLSEWACYYENIAYWKTHTEDPQATQLYSITFTQKQTDCISLPYLFIANEHSNK